MKIVLSERARFKRVGYVEARNFYVKLEQNLVKEVGMCAKTPLTPQEVKRFIEKELLNPDEI